jgi:hypothetical protein
VKAMIEKLRRQAQRDRKYWYWTDSGVLSVDHHSEAQPKSELNYGFTGSAF